MLVTKSITFDEETLGNVAAATKTLHGNSPADTAFLDRLRAGDAAAFDNLVLRYGPDIYGLLFRLTGDREESADLTQETFLSALKSISAFRGNSELKTWLFRIAINHSRNKFRWWKRRRRGVTVSLDEASPVTERPLSEELSDSTEGPEARMLRRERERKLAAALKKLPENFRLVVLLCDIEGLSYDEIAQTLEINLGTVKSRIARGREELRRYLAEF